MAHSITADDWGCRLHNVLILGSSAAHLGARMVISVFNTLVLIEFREDSFLKMQAISGSEPALQ